MVLASTLAANRVDMSPKLVSYINDWLLFWMTESSPRNSIMNGICEILNLHSVSGAFPAQGLN